MGTTYTDANGVEYYDKELTHVVPMKSFFHVAPTGYFYRKLVRRNTTHLRGICPECGKPNMKWAKELPIKTGLTYHSVWYCKNCKKIVNKEELKNVRYA